MISNVYFDAFDKFICKFMIFINLLRKYILLKSHVVNSN